MELIQSPGENSVDAGQQNIESNDVPGKEQGVGKIFFVFSRVTRRGGRGEGGHVKRGMAGVCRGQTGMRR